MSLLLGIDTGGTYTDAVVLEQPTRQILFKVKHRTTQEALRHGIRQCVDALPTAYLQELSLVCLSTTLATNAVVEGRGCQEGLLLIGGRPDGQLPTKHYRLLQGKCDILGHVRQPLDLQQVDEAISSFDCELASIAVSGYASVRNPQHELLVKQRVRELCNLPVTCAHELTSALGFYERTVTTVLNARLIPLIYQLIAAVKSVLLSRGIGAPLMVVRSDGTLMSEACAQERPIETILSGPAASIAGGIFLSGQPNALLLDMGGTTTDIANVSNAGVQIRSDGARVGGWSTHVRAAEVFTCGLGGDSRILPESGGHLSVGPQRVLPFALAGAAYPSLCDELTALRKKEGPPCLCLGFQEAECYQLAAAPFPHTDEDAWLLSALEDGPHTLFHLREQGKGLDPSGTLEKLLQSGRIRRIGLTPTDLLHLDKSYVQGNPAAAHCALALFAQSLSKAPADCLASAKEAVNAKLAQACVAATCYFDEETAPFSRQQEDFLSRLLNRSPGRTLLLQPQICKPIVAVGAPAAAWTKSLGRALGTSVFVPLHAEVANAVGAAVGQISERIRILIRFDPVAKVYLVFFPTSCQKFSTLEEAERFASSSGRQYAVSRLPGTDFEISETKEDLFLPLDGTDQPQFVERQISITAISKLSGEFQQLV